MTGETQRTSPSRKLRLMAAAIGLAAICAGCFVWGALMVRYRIFPMQQWQQLKGWMLGPPTAPPSTVKPQYWLDAVRIFAQSGVRANNVFVGDSMTASGQWPDLLTSKEIANRGIHGDTAAMLIDRLDSVTQTGADTVFVMIGINDFFRGASVEDVARNYRRIVDVVADDAKSVVLQSTIQVNCDRLAVRFPVREECHQLNDKVTALNAQLRQWSGGKLRYVDVNALVADGNGLQSEFTTDGIHLNSDGYVRWAQAVRPYLAPAPLRTGSHDLPDQQD